MANGRSWRPTPGPELPTMRAMSGQRSSSRRTRASIPLCLDAAPRFCWPQVPPGAQHLSKIRARPRLGAPPRQGLTWATTARQVAVPVPVSVLVHRASHSSRHRKRAGFRVRTRLPRDARTRVRRRDRVGLRWTADVEGCMVLHPSDWCLRIYSGAGSSTDSDPAQRRGCERCRKTGRDNLRDLDHHTARGRAIGNYL